MFFPYQLSLQGQLLCNGTHEHKLHFSAHWESLSKSFWLMDFPVQSIQLRVSLWFSSINSAPVLNTAGIQYQALHWHDRHTFVGTTFTRQSNKSGHYNNTTVTQMQALPYHFYLFICRRRLRPRTDTIFLPGPTGAYNLILQKINIGVATYNNIHLKKKRAKIIQHSSHL